MLRRLSRYWRPDLRIILAGLALLGLGTGLELLQPWPVKWLVDTVFGSQRVPEWLASLWPAFAARDPRARITGVCALIVVLAATHRAVTTLSQYLLIRAGSRMVKRLRGHVYDHVLRLSLRFHDAGKVGDTLYRIAYDTHAAQTLLSGVVIPTASGVLVLVGAAAVMLRMSPALTLTALSVTPLFWWTIRGFGCTIELQSRGYHERESGLVARLQESLSAIRIVQAYTRETSTSREFASRAGESVAAQECLVRSQLGFSAVVGLAVSCGTAAVVWVGAGEVLSGRLWPGDILVFLAYLGMLYQPMNALSQGAMTAQSSSAQLHRVFDVLATLPEVTDRAGARRLGRVEGRIEFSEVSFEYEPGRTVLSGINFCVDPGMVVALVGPTGAGKSTLASLILRFYDPNSGRVRLDGCDLRELQLQWLRSQVSIVLQDAVLFSGTIAENIAYGRPEADAEAIRRAAILARADDFIRDLPGGYAALLGERGVNLSGGQRQRLAIARAFLKDAPILILDEPTSALDARTEDALMDSLRELMQGRTTFIIAHRLSTVRQADMILVLDQGKIVEQGTHHHLMSRDTLYRSLHQLQQGGENGSRCAPAKGMLAGTA